MAGSYNSILIVILFFSSHANICFAKTENNQRLNVLSICTGKKKIKKKHEEVAYLKIYEKLNSFKKKFLVCKKNEYINWQKITIKRRGNSSDYFSKKQYLLKFFDAQTNKKIKVSLLSLKKDTSWVINGPYVDRTYIRNALAYEIGGAISKSIFFAPSTKFIEIYLDGNYRGLYVLTEKIKRQSKKVSISKTKNADALSLPFIAEVSAGDGHFKTSMGTHIKYVYPEKEDLKTTSKEETGHTDFIKKNIQENIKKFEIILNSNEYLNKILENIDNPIIHVDSFVNYILIQEVFKNIDGFRRSTYFHMDEKGIFHMGPLWDFNLSMGNLNFYDMEKTEGWLFKKKHLFHKHAFWFKALLQNKSFKKIFITKYKKLREKNQVFSDIEIENRIDKLVLQLKKAYSRDFLRWKNSHTFIEHFIFNTSPRVQSFSKNVDILKKWLKNRLSWIDKNIDFI